MKNYPILFFIFCVLLSFASCTRSSKTSSNSALVDGVSADKSAEQSAEDELEARLQKLTIDEIISLYINEKNGFFHTEAGDNEVSFVFLSHDKIQWAPGKNGFEYHPHFYIDDNIIHIEIFYYDLSAYQTIGERISAGKDYLRITKENLIAQYTGHLTFIENYTKKESFKINRFTHEDLFFKILSDTVVYNSDSLQGERIARIGKDMKVQIIDMFFNNSNDKYPASVRINIEGTGSGWVSADHVDFFPKEIKETVNGMWLFNAVKNVIKEYGMRAVKGNVTGGSAQLKSFPLNDSEDIILLWENAEVFIEEVSVSLNSGGGEEVWYKICLIEGQVNDQLIDMNVKVPADASGWIHGNRIEINPVIDLSFNAGYR